MSRNHKGEKSCLSSDFILHHGLFSDHVRDQIFFRNQKVATFATSSVEIGEKAAQCPYNDIVPISEKVTPDVGFKNYLYPSGGHSASETSYLCCREAPHTRTNASRKKPLSSSLPPKLSPSSNTMSDRGKSQPRSKLRESQRNIQGKLRGEDIIKRYN